jgi:hypothetical protein
LKDRFLQLMQDLGERINNNMEYWLRAYVLRYILQYSDTYIKKLQYFQVFLTYSLVAMYRKFKSSTNKRKAIFIIWH